jgi:hypothetical protein
MKIRKAQSMTTEKKNVERNRRISRNLGKECGLCLGEFCQLLGEHIYLAKPARPPIPLVRGEFVEAH